MPDFQNFKIEKLPDARINAIIPQYNISLTVNDSNSCEVIRNFTGAISIVFPNILTKLSDEDMQELMQTIVNWLMDKKLKGRV